MLWISCQQAVKIDINIERDLAYALKVRECPQILFLRGNRIMYKEKGEICDLPFHYWDVLEIFVFWCRHLNYLLQFPWREGFCNRNFFLQKSCNFMRNFHMQELQLNQSSLWYKIFLNSFIFLIKKKGYNFFWKKLQKKVPAHVCNKVLPLTRCIFAELRTADELVQMIAFFYYNAKKPSWIDDKALNIHHWAVSRAKQTVWKDILITVGLLCLRRYQWQTGVSCK